MALAYPQIRWKRLPDGSLTATTIHAAGDEMPGWYPTKEQALNPPASTISASAADDQVIADEAAATQRDR